MTEEKGPLDGGPRAGAHATEPRRGMLGDSVLLQGGTTLLDYEILPSPNPLQAGAEASLTLVVSNGGHALVTCTRIVVTLAVGTNAKALVASAAGITSQAPAGWSVAQSAGAFTLMPTTPAAGQVGALGLSFVFAGLAVNGEVGTTTLAIDERATMTAQPALERTGALELPKFPPQFTLGDLTARPLDVQAGGAATLSWSGSPATYRLEFNPGRGGQGVPVGNAGPYVAGRLTRYPAVTFTLVVTCAVPGQDQPLVAQKQAIVGVNLPPPLYVLTSGPQYGPGIHVYAVVS